jgi:hypothetical protein
MTPGRGLELQNGQTYFYRDCRLYEAPFAASGTGLHLRQ